MSAIGRHRLERCLTLCLLGCSALWPAAAGAESGYSARVRGDGPSDSGRVSLEGQELRTLPGSLGDPLRAIGLLPGVVAPLPLLPLFAVRGAAPGMSGFFLDGMRLPQLFHSFAGSAVIHGALIEGIDFFPGAYDASFGRQAGGVVSARTRPGRAGQHGEGELRLYDASAIAELSLGKELKVVASGRYGYPGLIVQAVDPRVSISYWDYHLRLEFRGLSLTALGSFDSIAISRSLVEGDLGGLSVNSTQVSFHRLQLRYLGRRGPASFEAAAVGGRDEQITFNGRGVRKLFLSARAIGALRLRRLRLRVGVEGELSSFEPQNILGEGAEALTDMMRVFGPGASPVPLEIGELGVARSGVTAGAFAELVADIIPERLSLTAGLRLDLYHADRFTLLGLDPRAQLRLRVTDWLTLRAGAGVYQQPPGFPVPLPGIDTFALRMGLQRALHGAFTEELLLPQALTLSLTGFYQRYENATDFALFPLPGCAAPRSPALSGLTSEWVRPSDGASYGGELLLRRHAGALTGWIAYTLSRSERRYGCGLRPTSYDQPHVLNAVAQLRLPLRFVVGVRLLFSSGRPADAGPAPPDPTKLPPLPGVTERFPDYVQLDLRLDRSWQFRRFAMALFLEVANVTYSELALFRSYRMLPGTMVPDYRYPEVQGFRWILPSIGIRGAL